MHTYALYLESGPRHQKTMAHVPDLLGCIASGPTTAAALEGAPGAIRAYQRFLARHDPSVDAGAAFETRVAEHITEGYFLGQGSTSVLFAPDREPLTPDEVERGAQRIEWLGAELDALLAGLTAGQLAAEPAEKGRPLAGILAHLLDAERAYLASGVGSVKALAAIMRQVEKGEGDLPALAVEARGIACARVRGLTEGERIQVTQRGQETWTARKMLRRMLEHRWEHLLEIGARLGKPVT